MIGFTGTRRLCLGLALMVTTACTAQTRTHGYVPLEEDLQQIVPGIDTRTTVEEVVGVPSTGGVLDSSGFYYVETRVREFAWQAAEVTDREVLAITFDTDGVVENIIRYGLEDGNVVPLARRVTNTGANNTSFLRQLFGNIGGIRAEDLLGGG